jgi:hypothetical protein
MLKVSTYRKRSFVMRKFMLVAAIASLSIVNAGVALAQAAVGEPGEYMFYHPNADVLNAGSGGPRAEPRNAMAAAPVVRPVHRHSRTH